MNEAGETMEFAGGQRYYARATVADLQLNDSSGLFSQLFEHSDFDIGLLQRDAWISQLEILRGALDGAHRSGELFFEFSVPRVGKRIDAVLILGDLIFILEFKIGAVKFPSHAVEQVWDYALDLKNFHSESHDKTIVPVLIASDAPSSVTDLVLKEGRQSVYQPLRSNSGSLRDAIANSLNCCNSVCVDPVKWSKGFYSPTPTIIDAAIALYGGHSVAEISRSDASATNLSDTSNTVARIIEESRRKEKKSICFVTGVPGAGKTLVGLNAATQHIDKSDELYSVFLSGNGPLVKILQEALARDKVGRERESGQKLTLSNARSEVKAFIQNVHHFRDEGLLNAQRAPHEHVALFDEAQRAWDHPQTAAFMKRKKGRPNFPMSEPEFLISCMDRHKDWAAIVCLVGGGQEINTGEAGISEWVEAIMRSYPDWHVYVSPNLRDSEFAAGPALDRLNSHPNTTFEPSLHLAVSMRSFRAENVSGLVKDILDLEVQLARENLAELKQRYPVVLSRDLKSAKAWVRDRAQGSERYGMVVSSQAQRLRPHAIDVRVNIDPVHWFLNPKEDVRSSWFLEEAASEFDVQGLELDWSVVVWDADFRHNGLGWENWSFTGGKWQRIHSPERKLYQKNAYRVLLTRARQGMVIVVPEGDWDDHTRSPDFYDPTFNYLSSLGIPVA
jgi:hypothetical protein